MIWNIITCVFWMVVNLAQSFWANSLKAIKEIDLVVKVESKNKSSAPSQCYRCQKFGHTQSRCTFSQKCVKCADDHPSNECKMEKTQEGRNAKCINCGQTGHPASYRGCPKYPLNLKKDTPKEKGNKNASPLNTRDPQKKRANPKPASQPKETEIDTTVVEITQEILPEIQKIIRQALAHKIQNGQ